MSLSSTIPYHSYFLDAASYVIGSLLIYSGVLGTFIDPLARNNSFPPPQTFPLSALTLPLPSPPPPIHPAEKVLSTDPINPTKRVVAKFFGLPTATAENVVLFPSATGRNLGAGLFVCILTGLGERKALGIFLLCWTWAGIADTKILYDHPQGRNQWMHIRNILILLVLGPLLIRSSSK